MNSYENGNNIHQWIDEFPLKTVVVSIFSQTKYKINTPRQNIFKSQYFAMAGQILMGFLGNLVKYRVPEIMGPQGRNLLS